MSLQHLKSLQQRVSDAIDSLPTTDPLKLVGPDDNHRDSDSQVRKIILKICADEDLPIGLRLQGEYFGSGPIEDLLTDPSVTEIMINGPETIWLERNGRLEQWPDQFLSRLTYRNFVARLSREAGFQTSLQCPYADGKWRDCRVHVITPPASMGEVLVTLRRQPISNWSFDLLKSLSWASKESIDTLHGLVTQRKNFLIVGGTGSGKTSVLNAALASVQGNERCVLIEDTDELKTPNSVSCKLLTRKDAQGLLTEIDQSHLLKQALRMRPDRMIMGEIRGGEAKDLLMAFATGHSGCMGTLHAESPRQALIRLEMLIQLGAPQWSLQAVRTLIWLSLQYVVVVQKTEKGQRRLEGIFRVASLEDLGFLVERVT